MWLTIISFQVKDWSRIFVQLLYHFYERTNKTQSYLIASNFEGTENKATDEH